MLEPRLRLETTTKTKKFTRRGLKEGSTYQNAKKHDKEKE
jgi:hypothetical protein